MPDWMMVSGPVLKGWGLREHKEAIIQMHSEGGTLQAIGNKYGVSRERVRQLLSEWGVTFKDGGAYKLSLEREKNRLLKRDARYLRTKGCDFETYQKIKADCNATVKYREQRRNAITRDIGWEFNLYTWWKVWQDSGKWNKRGRNIGGYVMARKGDTGPYSKDNVYITTCTQNIKDRKTRKGIKIKDQLRAYLSDNRVRQCDIAEKCGLDRGAISNYTSGRHRVSEKTLEKILGGLQMSRGEFLSLGKKESDK